MVENWVITIVIGAILIGVGTASQSWENESIQGGIDVITLITLLAGIPIFVIGLGKKIKDEFL